MNLVKEKQGGLVPPGLKSWPFKLIKHFADTTCIDSDDIAEIIFQKVDFEKKNEQTTKSMQNYPVGKALDEVTWKNADLEWSCLQSSVGHVCLDVPSSVKQRNARGLQRQVGL